MSVHNVIAEIKDNRSGVSGYASADGGQITLAAVTGVDGTASNAASKADVDARLVTIQTAINYLLAQNVAAGIIKGGA